MRKKSSFYHTRLNVVGLNEERTAEILGVSIEDVKRYDLEGAPVMAERLLRLWDHKHVGVEGWDGWLFSRGVLVNRGRRWTPKRILRCHDCDEEISKLRNELERLKTWRGLFTVFVDKLRRPTRRRLRRQKA